MENATEKILNNKMQETYGYENHKNLTIDNELTVTITLYEYRELIKKVAISDNEIDKARSEKYALQRQISTLEEKIQTLKSVIAGDRDEDEIEDE